MPFRVVLSLLVLGAIATATASAPAPAQAPLLARVGSAYIARNAGTRTYTIGSAGASLVLSLSPSTDFSIVKFGRDAGPAWVAGGSTDTTITIGSRDLPFGRRSAGFSYVTTTTSVRGARVQLDAVFDLPAWRLRVTRHYLVADGSPTFETWTTFTPLGAVPTISDINSLEMSVPAGRVHWLNGLRGETADRVGSATFALREQDLQPGAHLSLGATGRSSETTVPWFQVEGQNEVFYAGLMWSGAWSLDATRVGSRIDFSMGLPPMTTSLMTAVDGPHAFFGIAQGDAPDAAMALRAFIVNNLHEETPTTPLVTYNTWFAYGTAVDERSMEQEIDSAAALGAEVFVLDAGWYVGAGHSGIDDFSSGLGSWKVDASKFPGGLRKLGNYARARGVKFGLWVEPESVAQSTVGAYGLAEEKWLAKADGKYGSTVTAQVCLGGAVARQWLLDRLTQLIDDVRPDYLKWDNNMWINCNRSGHIHSATDGNFAHVNGLYQIMATLRERYPALLIENVSGGGNRLDLGMMRYTDAAWMDDMSTPAYVVRRNLEGLSAVFPPSYLLSFVMEGTNEPLHNTTTLPLSMRSRMLGALGLSVRGREFSEADRAVIQQEIAAYKEFRNLLTLGTHRLLSVQATAQGPSWEALQTSVSDGLPDLLWAFQRNPRAGPLTLKAEDLLATANYEVEQLGGASVGEASGEKLMQDGLQFLPQSGLSAQLVFVRPVIR